MADGVRTRLSLIARTHRTSPPEFMHTYLYGTCMQLSVLRSTPHNNFLLGTESLVQGETGFPPDPLQVHLTRDVLTP